MKMYCCSEYPEDGYLNAKDDEDAKKVFHCNECYDPDCCPGEVIEVVVDGYKILKWKSDINEKNRPSS